MPAKKKLPKTLAEVLKNKDWLEEFEKFCKKEQSMENYTFLTLKSWNSQNFYKIYLSKTAKYELNLTSPLMKEARALGEKKAWDDKAWDDIYEKAQDQIQKMVGRDAFKRFVVELSEAE